MSKGLIPSLLLGALLGAALAALIAPVWFGAMSNPDCCDFDPIPQGLAASLNLAPWGAALGALIGLALNVFRRRR